MPVPRPYVPRLKMLIRLLHQALGKGRKDRLSQVPLLEVWWVE